jgi:membrane protease YdiL (CAAX protease family)
MIRSGGFPPTARRILKRGIRMKKHPLAFFFLLSFLITWGLGGLFFLVPELLTRVFGPMSTHNLLFILAAWAPSISAFVVTAVTEGGAGLVRLLKRFSPGRAGFVWYPLALLGVPACSLLVNLATGSPIALFGMGARTLLGLLLINLATGSLGEEFGWRGLALPRLLRRYSPVVASLLLGAIWALWHLPSFLISGLPQGGIQFPVFFLAALALSVLVAWVFIRTEGSIFFSFLIHYGANFSLMVLTIPFLHLSLLQTALAVIVLAFFGWDLGRAKMLRRGKAVPG